MTLFKSALLLAVLGLAGCVTTTTGPEPASTEARVTARLDLARGYMENGEFDRARPALIRALELNPRSPEANVLMGLLNESQNDYVLAERHYRLALEVESDNAQALNNYGSFLFGRERYEEAVKVLRKLVENTDYRARSQAYENLGLAELKIGEVSRAEDALKRAIRLNFAQTRSSLELAVLAYEQGNYEAAQGYYDGFRTQARQSPRSLCLGMKLAAKAGNSDQVSSYALALHNLFPDSPETANCQVSN
jgi:type IV pilus assembly protein PilF